ncbi:permease [Gracilibacillus xinjiangensis]|uniref:Permease n=1 Tax=Gracilibacillus xinjiangensis TaxID=1193282 RepID=A0ABV8WS60_9BACI
MRRNLVSISLDLFLLCFFAIVVYVMTLNGSVSLFTVPDSVYQVNTIFLSILIEALPFVLIGVLIAGFIQIFITEEQIRRYIPKNKYAAIFMSCVVGSLFPACECGIVPIVRRLLSKGVPIYAGVGFLLTGPLINPIVIFSTYMAFGSDLQIALLRMGAGFLAALMISILIGFFYQTHQLKESRESNGCCDHDLEKGGIENKVGKTLLHSVDEFFDMGKYLIIGALLASFVQVYVSTDVLASIGDGPFLSVFVMMGLAYLLSLCSEADAFIASSFSGVFPTGAILSFLIYGPMIDLKNTLMMISVFKKRFVVVLISLITICVFIIITFIQIFL